MPIAGFDPSITHFGWVILDEISGSLLDHGTFKTSKKDGLLVQRLILQRERMRKLLQDYGITFVAMEAPYFMDFSTELLFALNQFIHEVYLNEGCFVLYLQPLTLKKFAIPHIKDSHNITKNHVVHQAKTELDMHGQRFSEHVADAYFAGKLGHIFHQWYFQESLKDEDLPEKLRTLFAGRHTLTRGPRKGITEYTGIIYKENDQFFDYRKHKRTTDTLIKEVHDAPQKDKRRKSS